MAARPGLTSLTVHERAFWERVVLVKLRIGGDLARALEQADEAVWALRARPTAE